MQSRHGYLDVRAEAPQKLHDLARQRGFPGDGFDEHAAPASVDDVIDCLNEGKCSAGLERADKLIAAHGMPPLMCPLLRRKAATISGVLCVCRSGVLFLGRPGKVL